MRSDNKAERTLMSMSCAEQYCTLPGADLRARGLPGQIARRQAAFGAKFQLEEAM